MMKLRRGVASSSARQTRHGIGGRAITPQGTRGFDDCQVLVGPSYRPNSLSSPR